MRTMLPIVRRDPSPKQQKKCITLCRVSSSIAPAVVSGSLITTRYHLLRSFVEELAEESLLSAEMLRDAIVLHPRPGENTLGLSFTSVAARSSV